MKLIKLQDKFILVSNEKPKAGEYSLYNNIKIHLCIEDIVGDEFKKIIAGIPELPEIDFSSDELGDEGRKIIGWVDAEKLAKLSWGNVHRTGVLGFIEGFQTCQSLNDKMFSLDDMRTAYDNGMSNIDSDGCAIDNCNEDFNDIIQSLQKTEWEIEVEMEDYLTEELALKGSFKNLRPKITNNSIKIVKIL